MQTRESVRRSLQLLKLACKEKRDTIAQMASPDMQFYVASQKALTSHRVRTSSDMIGHMRKRNYDQCLPFLYPREHPPKFNVVEHIMRTGVEEPTSTQPETFTKPIDFTTPRELSSWSIRAGVNSTASVSFDPSEFNVVEMINMLYIAYTAERHNENNRYRENANWKNIFITGGIVEVLGELRTHVMTKPDAGRRGLSANMSDYAIRRRGEETRPNTMENSNTWAYDFTMRTSAGEARIVATISLVCPSYNVSGLTVNKETHKIYNEEIAPKAGATWVQVRIHNTSNHVRHTLDITPFVSPRTAQVFPFTGRRVPGASEPKSKYEIAKHEPLFVDIPTPPSLHKAYPSIRFPEVDVMQLGLQTAYMSIMTDPEVLAAYKDMQTAVEATRTAPGNNDAQNALLRDFKVYYSTEEPTKGGVWVVWFIMLRDHIAGVQIRYPRTPVHIPSPARHLRPRRPPQQNQPASHPYQYAQQHRVLVPWGNAVPIYNPFMPIPPWAPSIPQDVGPNPFPPPPQPEAQPEQRAVRFQEPTRGGAGAPRGGRGGIRPAYGGRGGARPPVVRRGPSASQASEYEDPGMVPRHISRMAPPIMAPWEGPAVDIHSLARSIDEIKRTLNDTHLLKAALTA